jgi:hypothetical protein
MANGSLAGPIAKVSRAIEHYRAIKDDFLGGFDRRFRPVTSESHYNGMEYRFHVGSVVEVDPRFALVLGDGFFNLRSALDHLAYQLHVLELGEPLADSVERASSFPVCDTRPTQGNGRILRTDDWRGIKNLSPTLRGAVENLQPYHGWNDHHLYPRPRISELRQTLHEVN